MSRNKFSRGAQGSGTDIEGTLLEPPNRELQEYSRNIMEYKDPGRYIFVKGPPRAPPQYQFSSQECFVMNVLCLQEQPGLFFWGVRASLP